MALRLPHALPALALAACTLAPAAGASAPSRPVPPTNAPPTTAPAPEQIRSAIARSLVFLEKEGVRWMRERKCMACHHGPFLLWSHNEARRRGIPVDANKVRDWTAQALGLYLATRKDHEAKKNGGVEAANLLLGQAARPPADGKEALAFQAVGQLLANAQKTEGFWKYEGQGLTWPGPEADRATTLLALLATASWAGTGRAPNPAQERALAWLKSQLRGEGNEFAALQLALAARLGEAARTRALEGALLARQNSDGGWSWFKGRPSDAFATGQSLYALGRAGRRADDPAVCRALTYLLARQRPDGSWHSPTRKPTRRDNPIADYWGTAWATIGLAQILPEQAK